MAAPTRHHYCMTFYPNVAKVEFHGPFASQPEAAAFGKEWQAENDDSPCWNTLSGYDGLSVTHSPALGLPDAILTLLTEAHALRLARIKAAAEADDDEARCGHALHARAIRDALRRHGHENDARLLDGIAAGHLPVVESVA